MARLFKRLLWSVLALSLALGVALSVFVATLDPNDYKPRIVEYVSANTGRAFAVGDVGLSLVPHPGLAVAGITLANAPGFGDAPFLEAREMRLALEWLPLLSGEVRLGDIVLKGARLRLARDVRGRGNWQDMPRAAAASAAEAAAKDASADKRTGGTGEAAGGKFGLAALGRIEWEDSSITWRDASSGDAWDVHVGELRVGRWEAARPDRKIPLHFSGTARRASGLEASLQLTAQVSSDWRKSVRLDDVVAKMDVGGLPGDVRLKDVDVEGALALTGERITLDELALAFDDSRLTARGVFEMRGKDSQHRLDAQARALPLETAYALLAGDPKPPLRGVADARLSLTAHGDNGGRLRRSLGGNVALDVPDARYRGAALIKSFEHATAFLQRRKSGAPADELVISSASATLAFARGVGDNRDLAVATSLFDLSGEGQFDLARLQADYTLYLQLKQGEDARIPIRVTGGLGNLDYQVEYATFLKEEVIEKLDEGKEKLRELGKPLLDEIKDKLRLP